jgi:hypothetical protein
VIKIVGIKLVEVAAAAADDDDDDDDIDDVVGDLNADSAAMVLFRS